MGAFFALAISLVYRQTSKSSSYEDPRVKNALEAYNQYNNLTASNNYHGIFELMDSIETIYQKVPYYHHAFEIGVLHNNRSAAYLSMYLDDMQDTTNLLYNTLNDSLLTKAEYYAHQSLGVYNQWLSKYENKSKSDIKEEMEPTFIQGLENYTEKEQRSMLDKRLNVVTTALSEMPRRLSIVHTNLGTIYRHQQKYKMAIKQYNKALELWGKNLTAENNRNLLLGQPMKKHRVIDKFTSE